MSVPWLSWGGDLQIATNGSLVMANGWDEIRQSIERAILTNPQVTLPDGEVVGADYMFAPTFGAGLGLWVGQNPTQHTLRQLTRIVRNAILSQTGVDASQTPTVTFQPMAGGMGMEIQISVALLSGQIGTTTIPIAAAA